MKTPLLVFLLFSVLMGATIRYDTVSIKHKYYSTSFDTLKRYPLVVQWWVGKKMLSCQNRIDRGSNFTKDNLLPKYTSLDKDYQGSGYDCGHNMPAYDNGCDSVGMKECFFYSNMVPQTPRLNRGDWKELEDYTRDSVMVLDSIKVWCGSIGMEKRIGTVSVPTHCWKVLYIKKRRRYEAYLFANDTTSSTVQSHRTTTDVLYKMTGIRIKK